MCSDGTHRRSFLALQEHEIAAAPHRLCADMLDVDVVLSCATVREGDSQRHHSYPARAHVEAYLAWTVRRHASFSNWTVDAVK